MKDICGDQDLTLLILYHIFFERTESFSISEEMADLISTTPEGYVRFLKNFFQYIYNKGYTVIIKKSNRRKTEKDVETGKRFSIKTNNYSKKNIFDVLTGDFDECRCLSVHDFYIDKHKEFLDDLNLDIEDSLNAYVKGEFEIYGMDFEYAKKLLYRRIMASVEMSFEHDKNEDITPSIHMWLFMFGEDNPFPYVHMALIFKRLGYVDFGVFHKGFLTTSYLHEIPGCDVFIRSELQEIVKKHIIIDNRILDVIFNQKYQSIMVKGHKKGFLLEKTFHIDANQKKYVEVEKNYPHSSIEGKIYNGKTTKYKIIEKEIIEIGEKEL